METIYLVLVIVLLLLACVDLIVGVSNDASNFLTSAVGSKAGTFNTILIVAAFGVLIGSLSAGGMMEIARKGVFNPSLFSFHDIMIIYIVVMLADIFLLDTFNTLKLPTSTTIAIVFNLMGASLATSMIKVLHDGKSFSEWGEYINTTKAIEMVIAIFVSVAIAFVVGWLVQYIMRAWVTFDYTRNMKVAGSIFGGISIVVVLNFIVKVGFKESSLKDADFVHYINDHFGMIALATFILSSLLFLLLSMREGFDTFRVVTLIGTFALAMAFASNDLINFIGVPISSLDAYNLWRASGQGPHEYMMTEFSGESHAVNMGLLLFAGAIMVITMFRSKKTRAVIKTAVDLCRAQDGVERYQGNEIVRNIVAFITFTAKGVSSILPASVRANLNKRFDPIPENFDIPEEETPAFDNVRASVNLIVAASLVAIGTSLKLPLSTTYVSFMVLMGTSLADRAWNRDSAVYRVSGVFTVVSGWFLTAISALIISSIFVLICIQLGFWGVGLVILIVGLAVYQLNQYHKEQPSPVQISLDWPEEIFQAKDETALKSQLKKRTIDSSAAFGRYVNNLVEALAHEDKDAMRSLDKQLDYLMTANNANRNALSNSIRKMGTGQPQLARQIVEHYSLESNILEELTQLNDIAKLHILNMHRPLNHIQIEQLYTFKQHVNDYLNALYNGLETKSFYDAEARLSILNKTIEQAMDAQMSGVTDGAYNYKNTNLFVTTLFNNRASAEHLLRMVKGSV